jgi:hypothetical protein
VAASALCGIWLPVPVVALTVLGVASVSLVLVVGVLLSVLPVLWVSLPVVWVWPAHWVRAGMLGLTVLQIANPLFVHAWESAPTLSWSPGLSVSPAVLLVLLVVACSSILLRVISAHVPLHQLVLLALFFLLPVHALLFLLCISASASAV